jgi:hypothetical protein
MTGDPVVTLHERGKLLANPRRVRQARQLAQLARHLPVMVAGRNGGRRFV